MAENREFKLTKEEVETLFRAHYAAFNQTARDGYLVQAVEIDTFPGEGRKWFVSKGLFYRSGKRREPCIITPSFVFVDDITGKILHFTEESEQEKRTKGGGAG